MSTLRCAGWPSSSMAIGAPLVPVGAVVDERDERAGHLLADPAAEHRCVTIDEIGLEAVAARLVEEHTAGAALEHHGHLAARRRTRLQHVEGAAGGRAGHLVDVDLGEQLEADRAAGRLETRLHSRVAGRHALHHEAGAHLVIGRVQSVAVGHQDAPAAVGVRRAHLADRAALGARGRVGPLEQLDLARLRHVAGILRDRMGLPVGARFSATSRTPPPPLRAAAAAASAAACSPASERSAVWAKPVVSPRTTRMPAPRSRPDVSSSTRPSSR